MKKQDLQKLKEQLIALRCEILRAVKDIKETENSVSSKEASGDLSSYSFHMADQGTDSMDHQRNFIFAEMDGEVLHDIDDALDKIEDGSYGQCEECEEEIPIPRLEYLPYARMCVYCQAKEEEEMSKRRMLDSDFKFPSKEEEEYPSD